jgi:hypothetical protein
MAKPTEERLFTKDLILGEIDEGILNPELKAFLAGGALSCYNGHISAEERAALLKIETLNEFLVALLKTDQSKWFLLTKGE